MSQFSVPWNPSPRETDYGFTKKVLGFAAAFFAMAVGGYIAASLFFDGHPAAILFLTVGPAVTGALLVLVWIIVKNYLFVGAILFRLALFILLGAIISTCLGVWGVNLLFAYLTTDVLAAQANGPDATWFGGPLTVAEITEHFSFLPGFVAVTLWPFQFAYVRDAVALGALFGWFNLVPVYFIWWERKVAGRIQSRPGPMRVGGWHGWAQSFADGIKLVFKEDLIPAQADGILHRIAPYFAVVPTLVAFLAIPFGVGYVFRDMDIGLIFILGVLGVEVVAVILGGWASNNKWSLFGAMREACQMVSYEIPMGMSLLVPVLYVGSLRLTSFVEFQSDGWFSWLAFANPFCFVAFGSYFIASLASCKRTPFDLAESESELVAGFHTEYSGFRWALFFFAEYASMWVVAAIAAIVFLGGWNSPLPANWGADLGDGLMGQALRGLILSGPIWFVLKTVFLVYVQIWLRWTLPRIRIDQVLYACVQVLLPLTMVLLLGNVIWVWAASADVIWFNWVDFVIKLILGAIGAFMLLGFVAIAVYGFSNRRRMVGSLVVDLKPGS